MSRLQCDDDMANRVVLNKLHAGARPHYGVMFMTAGCHDVFHMSNSQILCASMHHHVSSQMDKKRDVSKTWHDVMLSHSLSTPLLRKYCISPDHASTKVVPIRWINMWQVMAHYRWLMLML